MFGAVWLAEKELELSDEGIHLPEFLPNQSGEGIITEALRSEA
ncbi:MAG TPA: hypothetical protein VLL54_21435 [Pyrinomonadaceae bacterium]|nr:hypothetical protein [Pyrinomonadaceae bacterium]